MSDKGELTNAPTPQFSGFLDGENKESEQENNVVNCMSHENNIVY